MSPTANLLRNSRLFSLPGPLVSPRDKVTLPPQHDSETATLPYPTQQALETTPSSLARGDWGLKRSLPLKSTTRTSTPTIRILEIDSINHITDFESAADHVLNLRKWQEIGLPVSLAQTTKRMYDNRDLKPHISVFETEYDNTQPESSIPDRERWKYRGPWIAGQTAGEFKDYTEQKIKRLKPHFRRFLRIRLEASVAAADRRDAIDHGMPVPEQAPKVDEQQLNQHIKKLRQENQGHLFNLIGEFLDLPESSTLDGAARSKWKSRPSRISSQEAWMASESGPPITHASAGLSYLRASGHTSNHPALGPQEHDRPVRARVLDDRNLSGNQGGNGKYIIGVGGVAVEARLGASTISPLGKGKSKNSISLDHDVPGGPKVWVQPEIVKVDSQGRIQVQTRPADRKTTALYEPEEQELTPDPMAKISRRMPNLTDVSSRSSNTGVNRTYDTNSDSNSETDRHTRRTHRPKPVEPQEYIVRLANALRQGKE